jgi:hypothetical protein
MKKYILILISTLYPLVTNFACQSPFVRNLTCQIPQNARPFHANLYNAEYEVSLHINFYEQDIIIPGQELFGEMAGYLVKDGTTYCWLIVSAKADDRRARLQISNDYGSEDLEAELTVEGDTLYTLKQSNGSTLKVPNKGKWQKLPRQMQFVKR